MLSHVHCKTRPKTRRVRFLQALALNLLLLGVANGTAGQDTEAKKPPQKKTATSSPKWIEDKVFCSNGFAVSIGHGQFGFGLHGDE
jgi:hypothetical protein